MTSGRLQSFEEFPRKGPAIAAMALAGFLFALMGAATKALHLARMVGLPIPSAEVVLIRHLSGILAMLGIWAVKPINLLGENRRGLLIRGTWGAFAVYLYFYSLQHTSLTHAQLLNWSSIVFAPLIAWWTLKERLTERTGASIIVAAAGIGLIAFATHTGQGATFTGDAAGLLSGVFAGAAINEIRRLRRSETAWSVFFYLSLVGAPVALIGCFTQNVVWPTAAGWGVLAIMGVCSVFAQVLMTYGFRYLGAAEGSLLTMTQLAYNALIGAWLFSESISWKTALGGALILGAGFVQSLPVLKSEKLNAES